MTTTAPATAAPVEAIRSRFPALERRHRGAPVAYFDGPGGTQVPQAVVDAMADYLLHHNANTHWAYPTSVETDAALAAAREALADFLGGKPSEIAFGANMTTLTFHLGRALGRRWAAGDEIVVTELDHHANVDPWRQLANERGLVVRAVRFRPETGQLDMDDLAATLGPKTRLLAIGAASNALGTKNDVRRAAELAHAKGALVFVDAVHYAPHASRRRGRARRRLPRLLGLQVLRAARGRAVGPSGARRGPGPAQARACPGERAGPGRDGHAEPRGHRRGGGGRGLPRLPVRTAPTGVPAWPPPWRRSTRGGRGSWRRSGPGCSRSPA